MRGWKTAAIVTSLLLVHLVAAEEIIEIDSPGVLDKSGATYILTRDVAAERTAFVIKGDDITLDLGGHTVTYGVAIGVDRCSGVFLRPPGGEEAFTGAPKAGFGGGDRFTLRNGRIVQGQQPLAEKLITRYGRILEAQGQAPGRSCFAVYVRGCNGLEITDVTTEVNSRDSDNLYIRGCSNVRVYNNHCISSVREITNRHWPGTGVITVEGVLGPVDIHHNVIDGGGQWGIRVSGEGPTGHLVQIHHNIIRHRSFTTNGYGIGAHAANMRIYANVIKPVAGRGVHLTGTAIDFFNNIVDVKEAPNPEYPRTRAHGLKLEGCSRTLVHHNFSRATAEEGFGDAAPLDFSVNTYSANRVYKNTIVALREPNADKFWAATINLVATEPNSLTQVHDNVFKTNHLHARVDWGGARGLTFTDNRFEIMGDPKDYHFWHFWQSRRAMSRDVVMRDSVLTHGADLKDVAILYGGTPRSGVDVRVEWSVNVRAADPAGKGVAGVVISVREGEEEVASALTDSDGRVSLALLDYRIIGDKENPIEEHGPYDLLAQYDGREVKRVTVDPRETTDVAITVTDPEKRLYVYAGENQRRRIGETATLSGTVKVIGGNVEPTLAWKQVGGPQQLAIKNADSAEAQVLMTAWGEYTFELEARLGGEVAKHRARVRADAKLRPQAVAQAPRTAKVNTIVQLDATKSTDPRRFPKSRIKYLWTQVGGPQISLSSNEWPDPIFYPTEPGTYTFEVTVSNPIRDSEPARCSVKVLGE